MGFFTPSIPWRRFVIASLIGLIWLFIVGLLWALPNGGYRRGWSFERYGILEAFVCVRDYRHTGGIVDYRAGDGFVLSVVITAVVTIAAIVVYLGLIKRKHKPGYCHRCGYDLRGTVSDTCPECGEIISQECQEPDHRLP